ncbi:MAG: hypothetical protein QOG01_1547 [Pseudonocardiales bacterium]|nr:hypothetical protein [Pseudonocardiales bacterium]
MGSLVLHRTPTCHDAWVPRVSGVGSLLLAVVMGGTVLGAIVLPALADADPPPRCSLTGGIGGPNPAHVGDTISVTASVGVRRGSCDATSVSITGGRRVLCARTLPSGTGTCSASFAAFRGLGTVRAFISTGRSATLGTFVVIDPTPKRTPTPTRSTRPPTPTPSSSVSARSASTSARASKSSASRAARSSTSASRASAPTSADFSTDVTDSAAPETAAAVTKSGGSGNGSPFPPVLLLVSLLVLAGLVGAAGWLIYAHNRADADDPDGGRAPGPRHLRT